MGTLGIIQALLFHIQGESNPVYIAEQRISATIAANSGLRRVSAWGGRLLFLLFLALPILSFIESQFRIRFSSFRDLFVGLVLMLIGGFLSVTWTVPVAMLAGQGISRERTAQTWATLMVTPYPTEEILMAKAAAHIRRVWKAVISLVFISSLPGLFLIAIFMLIQIAQRPDYTFLGLLFMGLGMIALVIEREQEIALAAVVGLVAAFISDSRRLTLLYGMIGGLLVRLVQTLIIIFLVLRLAPPNFVLMNFVAGSATMLATALELPQPTLWPLVWLIALIAGREWLIRKMFAWVVQRARE
jgi:hypothetical protein